LGEFFKFCTHGVYGLDEDRGQVFVKESFGYVVGCSSCPRLCRAAAISFPPLTDLRELLSGGMQNLIKAYYHLVYVKLR